MFRVYGHLVDKVCNLSISSDEGLRFAHDKYKPLMSAYGKPSKAKQAIYNSLEREFKDAIAYGVKSHNCSYFTFEACFDWGCITVYPTRRVASFWIDTPTDDCIVVVTP